MCNGILEMKLERRLICYQLMYRNKWEHRCAEYPRKLEGNCPKLLLIFQNRQIFGRQRQSNAKNREWTHALLLATSNLNFYDILNGLVYLLSNETWCPTSPHNIRKWLEPGDARRKTKTVTLWLRFKKEAYQLAQRGVEDSSAEELQGSI
jgi:hypothetical protein